MKVSLNLGGGAARGFAHIGAIRLFEEEKIPFDMIVGVSMGAVIGSIYASKPDSRYLKNVAVDFVHSKAFQDTLLGHFSEMMNSEKAKNIITKLGDAYKKGHLLSRVFLAPGLISKEEVDNFMFPSIPDIDIRDTEIPFACVAVNLYEGKKVIFEKGSLRETVIASSSLPMVLPPRIISEVPYVDGGVLDKVGIDTGYELGMDHIIAIDVSNEKLQKSMIKNSLDVLIRTEDIESVYRRKKQIKQATILIEPTLGHVHWADYSKYDTMIDAGYEAAREHLDEIRSKLKLTSPFKKMFSFLTSLSRKNKK